MGFLIVDPIQDVYRADRQGQPLEWLACSFSSPYRPCASREHMVLACRQSLNCICIHRNQPKQKIVFPALPALSGMDLSPCGRYLYQLSTEADCIHTIHLGSGELCYAMPVGVFPRSQQVSRDGQQLLIAGGAVSEAYLFAAPKLLPLGTLHTRHPCFQAAFWQDGFVFLCAKEGDPIETILYTLSPKAVRPREKLRLPGQPGALCICPDEESCLISTPDGLMRVHLNTGQILWNRPEWALCMQIAARNKQVLISDTLCGAAALINLDEPWKQRILCTGQDAQACFCP